MVVSCLSPVTICLNEILCQWLSSVCHLSPFSENEIWDFRSLKIGLTLLSLSVTTVVHNLVVTCRLYCHLSQLHLCNSALVEKSYFEFEIKQTF